MAAVRRHEGLLCLHARDEIAGAKPSTHTAGGEPLGLDDNKLIIDEGINGFTETLCIEPFVYLYPSFSLPLRSLPRIQLAQGASMSSPRRF
jgi:hypothetical protein